MTVLSISSLPTECHIRILNLLDNNQLYKCTLVNRYWCCLSVPMLWREPFMDHSYYRSSCKVIDSLLACLDENEISSLIPCSIQFKYREPLFDYGNYVKKIEHELVSDNVLAWLYEPGLINDGESIVDFDLVDDIDCRIEKLINAIYHVILRQGSKIREMSLSLEQGLAFEQGLCVDLPKFNIFTNYENSITSLGSLSIGGICADYPNVIEFLIMIPKYCNGITRVSLSISNVIIDPALNIIKSQPLQYISLHVDGLDTVAQTEVKKVFHALEYRSETLRELTFELQDFQDVDVSFLSKLKFLEQLKFIYCKGFTTQHYKSIIKKPQLKGLAFVCNSHSLNNLDNDFSVMKGMLNSLCGVSLLELSLNIVTPETIKVIKTSCPNIIFLHILICSKNFSDSTIHLICELTSLRNLYVKIQDEIGKDVGSLLVKTLGDDLKFVENLSLNFHFDLPCFEYFTKNCKANLKELNIIIDGIKDYLMCVNNYQKVHKSLNSLGINKWKPSTSEELDVIDSIRDQGICIKNWELRCCY